MSKERGTGSNNRKEGQESCLQSRKPIRVLHIVGAMYPGGMENFIMNLYRHIDREQIQFDFIVHLKRENDLCQEIEGLGGRVYLLPRLTRKPAENLREIQRLVRQNNYRVVIRHTANALVAPQLLAAKRAGAVTICHSHNETDPQVRLHQIGRLLMRRAADVRLACSEKAGRWMYGNQDFQIIHNAIDIDAFQYSSEKASGIRREFHLEGKHVYGHIANFIASKNHEYLLKIYRAIVDLDPKAVCCCLGEGDLRPAIEQQIQELGLQEHVVLTGIRKDVADFMSAMDVLIFPSKFEGLPLTLIEAQAAGLPSLISDTITKDVIVTEDLVEQFSIEVDPMIWARRAVELAAGEGAKKTASESTQSERNNRQPDSTLQHGNATRTCQKERIAAAGYDIEELSRWYQEFLLELSNKKQEAHKNDRR